MSDFSGTHDAKSAWRTRLVGVICVLMAQLLFGSTFAFNKWVIDREVDPLMLAFLRMVIAAAVLFPFFLRFRQAAAWTLRDWGRAAFVGAGACASAMALEYIGTGLTTASNVSLIISTEAVFSMFLAVLILKERLRLPTVIGGVVAMAGVFLVMARDIRGAALRLDGALLGDLLVLVSVICWGLYTVYSKRIVLHANPIYALFYVCIFAAIPLGAISMGMGLLGQIRAIELHTWMIIIFLGAFCSGLGHLLYYEALKRLPASMVALTLTLLPILGVSFAAYLLGERLAPLQWAGGAAIIMGVGYAIWPRGYKPPIASTTLRAE